MTTLKTYIYKTLCLLVLLPLVSCVMDFNEGCPDDMSSSKENWITLQFYVGEIVCTRANPSGGEDGNGREVEILKEAKLHDVNLFLFANDKSDNTDTYLLNASPQKLLTHLYFNLDDPGDRENTLEFKKEEKKEGNQVVYTVKFLDEVPGLVLPLRNEGTVRFITVANKGCSMRGEITKKDEATGNYIIELEDLQNYLSLSSTWAGSEQNVEDYDRFVMTTAYESPSTDSSIIFTGGAGVGTETNPFTGSTTLQRMCARIDLMYSGDNLISENDKSELIYSASTNGNKVHILNMLPVNVMSKPSYLFKKVTEGVPEDWTKTIDYTWGGKETTDINGIPSNYVLEPYTLQKEELTAANRDDCLNFWYGATKAESVKEAISSGDVGNVSGYYHGNLIKDETDQISLSYSKISVLGYANENIQSQKQFNSNYLTGIALRAVYVPNEIQGTATAPEKIYRYSQSNGGVVDESASLYFSDEATCKAYQDSHKGDDAVITEFDAIKHVDKWGFVCYYNLWLKHYDDVNDDNHSDPHAAFPMQYAIVRNNIYRVGLNFSGPGDPTPTMREPETMQARIFVRKWNLRKETNALEF